MINYFFLFLFISLVTELSNLKEQWIKAVIKARRIALAIIYLHFIAIQLVDVSII
jgi:hypothetical protein